MSVAGGEVVHGGAPLELILQKVEQVSAMFYRTADALCPRIGNAGGPTTSVRLVGHGYSRQQRVATSSQCASRSPVKERFSLRLR